MKLSHKWLKEYVEFDKTPEEMDRILTDCGLEVEGIEKVQSIKGGLEGIVIGEVMTCEQHPNADKLSKTTVDVGGERHLDIVCGAPNVAAGQKVLVATVGTTLYDGDDSFKIKKSKIRGEASEGMICAEDELGLGKSHDGIMVLEADAQVGQEAKAFFNIEDDFVYEIGLTPNRSDATSHIGSARDVVAVLNHINQNKGASLKMPSVDDFKVDNTDLDIEIEVEDEAACPRYSGVTLSNLKVGESPEWLKNYLEAIDIRSINNLVDITNFVMLETGQPLHAFDAKAVTGNKVIVKKMAKDSTFVTLDDVERKLSGEDLMICNAEEGMCIGGVFGGSKSGVTDETTSIFLESACFDPKTIRLTSKFHTLKTDASFRFERGTDPNITVYALKRAALLMKEIAGGVISSEIKDFYPNPVAPVEIDVKYTNVDRLIGKSIDRSQIKSILEDLDILVVNETEEGIRVAVPTVKVEVTREADIIEEILRVYGMNHIHFTDQVHSALAFSKKPNPEKYQNMISDYLSANGYAEGMNNSLTKSSYYIKDENYDEKTLVRMLNPLSSDLDVLRQSLLFGSLENLVYNINRKEPNVKLYEFGKAYQFKNPEADVVTKRYQEEKHLAIILSGQEKLENWNHDKKEIDFFFVKSMVQRILTKLQFTAKEITAEKTTNKQFKEGLVISVRKKPVVEFGELSSKLLKSFGIKQKAFYADFNWENVMKLSKQFDVQMEEIVKFPMVRRDLALVVDKSVTFGEIEAIAHKAEKNILKSVGLFDVFEGKPLEEGEKSYSINFFLQDNNKTLNDKQIDKLMNRLIMLYEKELGALIRK
ncbi:MULTISPECIES: phenylalanine--tRNA ligase subunit beta [unclassified Lentimicrobium]|uniref:phenylalanine--tRNA ligase subunit beta n=1 Tax=unclassified Lentimicrobium TaxID=2677434 RepID=UPI0015555A50|nr:MULTISPECIES: phenylalanine--tRNA ligase subunit beta [unclassified Lentimicrobium]NPD45814.1 phenylalanine--tRNA ligase subunit beta [Lentimicrobium sp. S6]NPD85821.1 phenylalanine--tRNA ligase subunit beta [Lentimicrobium sp. L6]